MLCQEIWIHIQAYCPPHTDMPYYLSHYDGEIRYMDSQIGRLLKAMEQLDALKGTVVVFTADHGEFMGDPDGNAKFFFSHGETLANAEIHVPLIIRAPGVPGYEGSRRVAETVESADVFPTVLDLLDTPPPDCDGKSFRGLLEAGNATAPFEKHAFSYCFESNLVSIHDGSWKLIWHPKASIAKYFNQESGYASVCKEGRWELFDMHRPGPALDPARIRSDVIRSLQDELLDRLRVPPARRDLSHYPRCLPLADPELIDHLKSLGYL